ncbi:DUF2147 domain-containing protein [Sphingomonas melonis]|uniref:Uncharacterized protein (DUF2147 family) n=1 Tax=Sphingomonas melonis TaxID=152682 RepID=A0A7Y9K4B1_9SPHN|nr:DUF2147 domain-containing protein [Sphingomonas melonis]NYD91190.1 uncharacterized protein (DUF2147 family) [Sphingomonas melonis]
MSRVDLQARRSIALAWGVVLTLCCGPAMAQADRPTDVAGRWQTDRDDGVVTIDRCGRELCGRVVGGGRLSANPDQRDTHNADPVLRERRVEGLVVLDHIRSERGVWRAGPVYDPLSGRSAPAATLTPRADGTLEVKACLAAILCTVQRWHRQR